MPADDISPKKEVFKHHTVRNTLRDAFHLLSRKASRDRIRDSYLPKSDAVGVQVIKAKKGR